MNKPSSLDSRVVNGSLIEPITEENAEEDGDDEASDMSPLATIKSKKKLGGKWHQRHALPKFRNQDDVEADEDDDEDDDVSDRTTSDQENPRSDTEEELADD